MKKGVLTGLNFGLTSGVITTLGMMVGMHSGTHSTLAVVGGILTIAVADSMSDALGIHVSKEAENTLSTSELWLATVITLITKFVMACSFLLPVLLFELDVAITVSVIWGLLVLTLISYKLARSQQENPMHVIAEHLAIAILVIILTHYLGDWIASVFA
ncbi:MAG: hypothetical protein OQL09_03195 [Gammaproteobacteria bacterium]|nr:hypothetical protein [Gammaproteobacteria bacterium]